MFEGVSPLVLDEVWAGFVRRRVSMHVAALDSGCFPVAVSGLGCAVSADRRQITLYLPKNGSEALVEGVQLHRQLAVVFSQPGSHRTLQIKGRLLEVRAMRPDEAGHLAQYREGFVEELLPLGFSAEFCAAYLSPGEGEVVALVCAPEQLFDQTPGPRAGQRLAGESC